MLVSSSETFLWITNLNVYLLTQHPHWNYNRHLKVNRTACNFSPFPINRILGKLWYSLTHWNAVAMYTKELQPYSQQHGWVVFFLNQMSNKVFFSFIFISWSLINIIWKENIGCKKLHMVWYHFLVSQNTFSDAHLCDKIYISVFKKSGEL